MPGPVANAVPSAVMPQLLCTAFSEKRAFESRVNEYHDGSRQSSAMVSSSRRSWSLRHRLTAAAIETLWQFWVANQHTAFYYYNPFEPAAGQPVGSNYDGAGVSTQGRYTLRFNGDWNQSTYVPRADCTLELIEVA
jgi:hypothetical protein